MNEWVRPKAFVMEHVQAHLAQQRNDQRAKISASSIRGISKAANILLIGGRP